MESNECLVYELDIDPKTVCRICLGQPTVLSNVFSQSIVDGYLVAVPDIITYTLDINVDRGDNLPQKICADCKKQLIAFYTFKEKSKRIEKSLQDMFQKTVNVKVEVAGNVECVDDDDSDASGDISCSVCDKCFKTDDEFYHHIETDHNQIELEAETEAEADIDVDAVVEIDNDEAESSELLFHVGFEDDDNDSYVVIPSKSSPAKKRQAKIEASTSSHANSTKRAKIDTDTVLIDATDDSEIFEAFDDDDGSALDDDDADSNSNSNSLNIDQFQCVLCFKSFTDRQKYIVHSKSHDFNCASCNRVFSDAESLASHEVIHERVKAKRNYSEFIRDDMFCVPCNKRLKSSSQVDQHYKMHDAISMVVNYMDFYPCHECQIVYASDERLAGHMDEIHPDRSAKANSGKTNQSLKMLQDQDDESYLDYQFLEDEKDVNEYKEGQYACGECDIVYPSARELKNHAVLHQSKFKCPIHGCGCQYDQLSRLSIHIFHKHINSANLQCLHCQEACETYDKLQAHMKEECREKKYKCHHCAKKFFSKKALLTHLKTLKEKKYSCNFCGKTFKQQGELTIHTRSHTNERPFQCTICEKSYKTSSMRAAHMDSHITGKTFECDLCQKKLQSRTSYRNHMKRHTEIKKHICECGKRFFTKYHLRLHYTKIHDRKGTQVKMEFDEDE